MTVVRCAAHQRPCGHVASPSPGPIGGLMTRCGPPALGRESNNRTVIGRRLTLIQNNSGLPQPLYIHSNSPSSGGVHFVLAEQEFIFHCVRAGSLSAANSVATALRGTEQKRCRKWLVARD